MTEQLTLPEIPPAVSTEVALAVLQEFAPDKLMAAYERNSLLRHVQAGQPVRYWTFIYKYEKIWKVQMPELAAALEQVEAAKAVIAAMREEDDAKTD